MSGKKLCLWRAIDADADFFDILVQQRRNTKSTRRFFPRRVKDFGSPCVVMTGKLGSHVNPVQTIALNADHRAHRALNKIENAHPLIRKKEKIIRRFKSPRQAQWFLSAHDQIRTIFRPRR